jgi:hypothetical protein
MRVVGIGALTNMGEYWRLLYDQCGHRQDFPRLGLEHPEDAIREVDRRYAKCLTCKYETRLQREPIW